jgi:YidC/Oxa1 family membrane protein insertase
MQDTGMTKRIFIATFISFIFFMAYDYFFIQPQIQQTQSKQQTKPQPKTTKNEVVNKEVNSINSNKIIATIKSENFEIHIDELGRISQYILEKNIFNDDKGKKLQILGDKLPKPLEIRFKDENLNKKAFTTPVEVDKKEITLNKEAKSITITQNLGEVILKKIITFYPDGHYDVDVKLNKNKAYFLSVGYEPQANVNMYAFHGALIVNPDGSLEMIDDGDGETKTFHNIKIAATVDQYYTTFLYDLKNGLTVYETIDNLENKNPILFIEGKQNLSIHGYIGPKYVEVLRNINPELTKVVEYGIMTFMAKPMFSVLNFIYKFVHNWGLAIIIFVVLVRVILFPLTYRGMVSMYKLKLMAPKMQELKEKYSKDPKKFQMKMMELYKKEGANPLGGCLPMLIQIPIFFSIYRVLVNAIELKGASFLWIHDLSSMDPYFILPVLMGVTMYAHQAITPNNFTDPMQEKVFKFLPVIFTIFMATFASGLVLYWTTNNILSFIQQFIINKAMEAKGLVIKEDKK